MFGGVLEPLLLRAEWPEVPSIPVELDAKTLGGLAGVSRELPSADADWVEKLATKEFGAAAEGGLMHEFIKEVTELCVVVGMGPDVGIGIGTVPVGEVYPEVG